MRDSAVLSRPLDKNVAWPETRARRFPIPPTVVILGGLLLLSLAIGFGLTRIVPGAPTQTVSNAEYTAVVAQLYLHDHDVSLARERLLAIGSPDDLVRSAIAAAQAGRLTSPNDQAALDALSTALQTPAGAPSALASTPTNNGQAAVETPSANGETSTGTPVSTVTRDAAASSDATATSSAADASSTNGDSRPSWIGPLVAFFLALALGFLVLARTAGISLAGLRPSLNGAGGTRRPSAPSPRRSNVMPHRGDPDHPSSISMSEVSLDEETDARDDEDELYRPAVPRVRTSRGGRAAVVAPTRPKVFQTQYRLGDDPFEEIHPITDPRTGGLIAACGLTATLRLDSIRSGGYYAFTAWIQDYAEGDELRAAGFVAPGSTEIARGAIDSWVRSGQVDTVLAIEPGATAKVGTEDVKATVTIVDAAYGRDDRVADAFITGLTVRFEIHQHDADEEADA